MIGRFEQFEFMPEELRNMTLKCNPKTCVDDKCRDCAYQRTYEEYISEGKTGRDLTCIVQNTVNTDHIEI